MPGVNAGFARIAHSLGMKGAAEAASCGCAAANPRTLISPGAAENSEWFAQYVPFLEHYAQLAASIHADVFFASASSWKKMSGNDAAWRKLIARAARKFIPGRSPMPPTSAPNSKSIKFWDALDYIGNRRNTIRSPTTSLPLPSSRKSPGRRVAPLSKGRCSYHRSRASPGVVEAKPCSVGRPLSPRRSRKSKPKATTRLLSGLL